MDNQISLDELVEEHLARRQYSQSTIDVYRMWITRLAEYYAGTQPQDISIEQIEKFLVDLATRKKLSSHSVHQAAHAIHTVYNDILKKDYSVTSLSSLPPREYELQEVLTPDEIIDLLNNAHNPKAKLVFATAYSAGLLVSEVGRLRVKDVDFKNRRLHIRDNQGRVSRKAILSEYLAIELEEYLTHHKPKTWLFEGKDPDSPYSANAIQRAFKKALRKAGITKDATPRTLKYSYVQHLEMQGVPLRSTLRELNMATSFSSRTYEFYSRILRQQEQIEVAHSPLDRIVYQSGAEINTKALERLLFRLRNEDEKDYLLEAVRCIQAGAYRAGVVFAWSAAIRNIHNRCMRHSAHTELTPENWTGPIVQVKSVQRGKHNVRATSIHTRVQGPGGAGRTHWRQGQGRDLPGVPAEAAGLLTVAGRIPRPGVRDLCHGAESWR